MQLQSVSMNPSEITDHANVVVGYGDYTPWNMNVPRDPEWNNSNRRYWNSHECKPTNKESDIE